MIIGVIKRSIGKIISLRGGLSLPGDALPTGKRRLGISFIYIAILFPFLLGILSSPRISSRIFRIH